MDGTDIDFYILHFVKQACKISFTVHTTMATIAYSYDDYGTSHMHNKNSRYKTLTYFLD